MNRTIVNAAKAGRMRLMCWWQVLERWLKLAGRIRRTLLIRYLDNDAEVLISAAFADAEQRGLRPICIFLSYSPADNDIRTLLSDPRVASVGIKDSPFEPQLPAEMREDPRIGRYWEPGRWTMPVPAADVYFVGPWRLITTAMLREATCCELASLRVRVAIYWATVPLTVFRAIELLSHPLHMALVGLHRSWQRRWQIRLIPARFRPDAAKPGAPISKSKSLQGQAAFERMLNASYPRTSAVSGRIVHVCGNLQPGGAERQLVYTLQGLAQQDFESVRLLCHSLRSDTGDRSDFHLQTVRAIGIEAREIRQCATESAMPASLSEMAKSLPSGLLVDIANLFWEFVEIRPEVVHAWLDWDNVRSGLAAAMAGVPKIILSGRNINPSHFALYQPYMAPAYQVLARRDNVTLINNSRAGADDYADWIGIAREKIRVVHNGVDLGAQMRAPDDAVKAFRAVLGIPGEAFVVGGVFRLEAEKRPLLWIDTAAAVARRVPDAWFVIFGQGSLLEQMRAAAERSGLAGRLIMPGLTDDILLVMSTIDVLLLTSFGEGLPNVLLEAQWTGTPVVTTDVGGATEAIDPRVTGWAIASDSAQDLARQIIWLYANPEPRRAVRDQGPAFVRRRFGVERMVCETASLYKTTKGAITATSRAGGALAGTGLTILVRKKLAALALLLHWSTNVRSRTGLQRSDHQRQR
jgi:glycosyltransferase involved in cell wall biosynthesis